MKLKLAFGFLMVAGVLASTIPTASAYMDSLGRVFPGPKPGSHKIVKKKAKVVKKVTPKITKKVIKKTK